MRMESKRTYKPLNLFTNQSDDLKKLISEYPDYQIVMLVDTDVVFDDDYTSWYAPHITFYVGEILDCEQSVNDLKVYTDRDDFEEDVRYMLECDDSIPEDISDDAFDKLVETEMQKYASYWKPVIIIHGTV